MKSKHFLTPDQAVASNPEHNIWVQANAGTGKTSVLVQRLLQILFRLSQDNERKNSLSGILCLTYTNAGAGEMRNRILEKLQKWAMLDDEQLTEVLQTLKSGQEVTDTDLKSARDVLNTYNYNPDILKIKTIHGFCEEILRRFPIEAGISPVWNLIPEADQKNMMAQTFDNLINKQSNNEKKERITAAFDVILNQITEFSLDDLLGLLSSQYKYFFKIDDVEDYRIEFHKYINKYLKLDKPVDKSFNKSDLEKILELANNEKAKPNYIQKIIDLTNKYINGDIDFDIYKTAYLTKTGDTPIHHLAKKDWATDEKMRVYNIRQYELNEQIAENTFALFDLSAAFAVEYKKIKSEKNILDFDDMILYTRRLFSSPENMGWVLSSLDMTISHILVDEAQDTSPEQWDILKSLSLDFFVEGNSADKQRCLFVVGDSKQSIYGFQGADATVFANSRQEIIEQIKNNYKSIREVPLVQSFRSSPAVLETVDYLFNSDAVKEISNFVNNDHKAFRSDAHGIVEIHKPLPKAMDDNTSDEESDDDDDFDSVTTKELLAEYIKNISDKIEYLINHKNTAPKDIMILVQNRKPFAAPLLKELKKRNVPVEGSDKIVLPEFPPIRDLLNLLRFCLDNTDDYSLCCVLKSPCYRFTEQQIFDLCHNRKSGEVKYTVFEMLLNQHPDIHSELLQIIEMATVMAPYTFVTTLFNQFNFKEKFISALGQSVIDPLNEFVTMCLAYERTKPGTLKHFIKWFITGGSQIKRDMSAENGVRIVTVHGSKGLESKVVFLIDTFKKPESGKAKIIPIDSLVEQKNTLDSYIKWLWKAKSSNSEAEQFAVDHLMNAQTEEYYRLLYVAMTRAKDDLYIYGMTGKKNLPEKSWFTVLHKVLTDMPDAKIENDIIRIEK